MRSTVKLPIGIENFEEIRTEGFYYIDKTGLIKELLNNWGLLSHREDWDVNPNAELGDGFSDILAETEDGKTGIVIEVKYPDGGDLETGCAEALRQIEEMGYENRLRQDGMTVILKYGIACNKKRWFKQPSRRKKRERYKEIAATTPK